MQLYSTVGNGQEALHEEVFPLDLSRSLPKATYHKSMPCKVAQKQRFNSGSRRTPNKAVESGSQVSKNPVSGSEQRPTIASRGRPPGPVSFLVGKLTMVG